MEGAGMETIESWHGTRSGYDRHKCRCDECRAMNTSRTLAWRSANLDKARATEAAWRVANPEKVRAQQLARRDRMYGLTPGQFETMLADQGNRCASCNDDFGDQIPHVDHDHSCCSGSRYTCGKCVRGLLCGRCNPGIGYFGDDPARLIAAAEYLQRFL